MRTTDRRALLGGLAATVAAGPGGAAQARDADDAALNFLGLTGAPGLSVALARDGRIRFARSWGRTGPVGSPLNTRHRFRIASLSKPITSAAIMTLAERQRLSMDSRVFGPGSLLGQTYGPTTGWLNEMTVAHLLSHTLGGWTNDGTDPTMQVDGRSQAQMIAAAVRGLPLTARPGTRQQYSNLGYCLLGRIVEAVTGEGYEPWVRREVLGPCGADGMRMGDRAPAQGEVSYVSISGGDPYDHDQRRLEAAGGWVASPTELLKFLVRVDGFTAVRDVLHPNTTRSMATVPGAIAGGAYGHGWQVDEQDVWWHTGVLPGTAAFMCRTPGGYAFAALANLGGPRTDVVYKMQLATWAMARAQPGWRL